jgi:thioredoxin-dependent peroxiredoxin
MLTTSLLFTLMAAFALVLAAQAFAADAGGGARTVNMRGKPLTLTGNSVKVGDKAPAFSAVANDMSAYTFDPKPGQVYVISSVPSLDTPVCAIETRRFNEEATKLGANVTVLAISMDLPFAQKRWCGAEGIKNVQTISDYKDRSFGQAYGVYIKEIGLLARCIFVVKEGKISYVQLVPEVTSEPDYQAVINAVK